MTRAVCRRQELCWCDPWADPGCLLAGNSAQKRDLLPKWGGEWPRKAQVLTCDLHVCSYTCTHLYTTHTLFSLKSISQIGIVLCFVFMCFWSSTIFLMHKRGLFYTALLFAECSRKATLSKTIWMNHIGISSLVDFNNLLMNTEIIL